MAEIYLRRAQLQDLTAIMKIIDDAKELVAKLEEIIGAADYSMESSELVDWVCENLDMPMLKTNPLFARTVACCRKDRK